MITMTTDEDKRIGAYGRPVSYVGLSTDTKPTPTKNGSTFLEMDTGNVYIYDAQNDVWRAL